MTMTDDLRPYGPGKFDTMLDAYVYDVSCESGPDAECGSVDEVGHWYGLMRRGSTIFRNHDPNLEPLTDAERNYLVSCAGAIIREDSNGFVDVTYYDTMAELDAAWAEIEAEHDEERR